MDKRVALVTGASRGIGRAIALQLAADGLFVVVNYAQNREAAEEVRGKITAAGGAAEVCGFDVADREQAESSIKQLTTAHGIVDVLVNNAAIGCDKPLVRVQAEDWDRTLAVNLSGVHYCTRAVVKGWAGKKCGSRIVNISSVIGERGIRDASTYCATKAAVIGLTKSLAQELAHKQVTVNAVSPGFILTDATAEMPPERYVPHIPLGRAGQPEEIANMVSYLVSDKAAYITGQVFRVDGGYAM